MVRSSNLDREKGCSFQRSQAVNNVDKSYGHITCTQIYLPLSTFGRQHCEGSAFESLSSCRPSAMLPKKIHLPPPPKRKRTLSWYSTQRDQSPFHLNSSQPANSLHVIKGQLCILIIFHCTCELSAILHSKLHPFIFSSPYTYRHPSSIHSIQTDPCSVPQ